MKTFAPRPLRLADLRLVAALAILASCTFGATACSPMAYTHGVPNLHQVDPGVYRGGEPTHEGWVYLQSLGVKTVVKLNGEEEGSDNDARALGFKVVDVPMPPGEVLTTFEGPSEAQATAAVSALMNAGEWPVYVHCTHGQDRTGLIVGLFRVVHDHWTKSAAWTEMKADGFHDELTGLTKFWAQFDGNLTPASSPSSAPAPALE